MSFPRQMTDHSIDLVQPVAGGDDHRHVGAGADFAQQVQTIILAQPQVEDDETRLVL